MASDDYVIKRNGTKEKFSFNKILNRLDKLGNGELQINYTSLVKKIMDRLYNNITTLEIDKLTAEQCAALSTTHYDYYSLAARILISNHQKQTDSSFSTVVRRLYNFRDVNGKRSPIVSRELFNLATKYKNELEEMIDYNRDYLIDFFGYKTLERAYLMRINKKIVERPQHMWMRVALAIHKDNLEKVKETYDGLSQKYFTHATPTLFNAGTPRQQLSSCYLLSMEDDSIQGIFSTLSDCAQISKWAGGIGLHIHNVRAKGSHIRGTNGTSNGIVPMLRVFNDTARYVDQCILPETYLYTTDGPKEIQHCEAGKTEIFTTKGVEVIENILEHSYEGNMYSINTLSSIEPLKITPEHPVYCLTNQKKGTNYDVIKNRLDKNIIKPEWVDVKDINCDDFVIYKKPKYTNDNNYTEEDCYMYGILLGDGTMTNTSTTTKVTLHKENKKKVLDFIKLYLEQRYIQYFVTEENNTVKIRWNKTINLPFRYHMMYDENKEKYIHNKFLNLPNNKIKQLIKGLIDTDGCIYKEICFDSTSRKLIEGMRYMLLRLCIPTSGYIRDRVGKKHTSKYGSVIENKKISYTLRIPKDEQLVDLLNIESGKFFKYFTYGDNIYSRISSITLERYSGTLYDLQMKETHNYLTHNGIIHNGGGKRSGSFAMYIEPWHKDIFEFLELKKTHGDEEARARDLFYALWIPDLFMKRVKSGQKWTLFCPDENPGLADVYGDEFEALYEKYEKENEEKEEKDRKGKIINARDLWYKVLSSQIETGTPYMLYKDACNKKSNQKNLGTIKSSNLCCVRGDTYLLTDKGHIEIKDLENKKVNVWNGLEYSEVEVKQTNENADLLKVTFSDGSELNCTKYHKFFIRNNDENTKKQVEYFIMEAKDLKPDMELCDCNYPIIDNKRKIEYDFDKNLIPLNYGLKSQLSWFSSYVDLNGYIKQENSKQELIILNSNKEKLEKVKLMLQTCGIGMGISLKYENNIYELVLTNNALKKLIKIGFKSNKIIIYKNENKIEEKQYIKVVKIEDKGEKSKTYCFTEPKRHAGIFNGIFTSQCEIIEYSDSKETAVCNLASIALSRFIKAPIKEIKTFKIYSKTTCVYCKMAKNYIKPFNVDKYEEINLDEDKYKKEIYEYLGKKYDKEVKSVPQIIINDEYVGGYVELLEYLKYTFDYEELHRITKIVTENLNKVIDINYYPTEKTKRSNMRHRPIGIGVQGLADCFAKLNLPFQSEEAALVNKNIFETMYHAALERSNELAVKDGSYNTFENSPASKGILQYDMWNVEQTKRYDWDKLKENIMKNGLRNSLLLAPMPTASTSQILGNNECFEPFTSLIYSRRTLAGEFVIINRHLMKELIELGIWDEDLKNEIIRNQGSIQNIKGVPKFLKNKYRIVWEMPMKVLINMARDRGAYIDQSQSMNLWMAVPTYDKLTAMHFYSWKCGLKTGLYYLRSKPKAFAQQFTIAPKEEDECLACGS